MNKKGLTIIELLISISLISVVVLMLLKLIFSLNKINNSDMYASDDEITRTEIIKNIESDFLKKKLNGINIINAKNTIIEFNYYNESKELIIESGKVVYDNSYVLKSKNATYSLCPNYGYQELDNNYYLIKIEIPVLINGVNTTSNDDLVLTYIGLKNSDNSYLTSYECVKK